MITFWNQYKINITWRCYTDWVLQEAEGDTQLEYKVLLGSNICEWKRGGRMIGRGSC